MNTNKILITSLISISFLFTGFKAETEEYSRVLGNYDDYTYDFVLKEEREDTSHKTYTYFEYNFTNIGEGYLLDVIVSSFGWLRAEKKPVGDVFKYDFRFLEPNSSAIYSFEIYDYNDEEITFQGRGYKATDLASNITYSNFNLEYMGTPGNTDGVYKYCYVLTMDISYDKNADFDYTEYLFVNYKDVTYSFYFGSNDAWVYAKEEIDEEQISARAVVFREGRIKGEQDYYNNGPNIFRLLQIVFIAVFVLPLTAALIPPVILIVDKCKKSKAKKS